LRWKCTVSAPSGACNSVPKKMPNPSPRKPRRAAIQVTSVSRIVKNAKTRFPNSMYEWKLFGSKWCGAQPGQCSQPSPDPVSRTVAPVATIRISITAFANARRWNDSGESAKPRRRANGCALASISAL